MSKIKQTHVKLGKYIKQGLCHNCFQLFFIFCFSMSMINTWIFLCLLDRFCLLIGKLDLFPLIWFPMHLFCTFYLPFFFFASLSYFPSCVLNQFCITFCFHTFNSVDIVPATIQSHERLSPAPNLGFCPVLILGVVYTTCWASWWILHSGATHQAVRNSCFPGMSQQIVHSPRQSQEKAFNLSQEVEPLFSPSIQALVWLFYLSLAVVLSLPKAATL